MEMSKVSQQNTEYALTSSGLQARQHSPQQFALKKTAAMYGDEFSPEAASFMESHFYIYNEVISTITAEHALQLVQDSVSLCSKGGFKLHKLVSNDEHFLQTLQTLPVYNLCHKALVRY